MSLLYLLGAIASEVTATLSLKLASDGKGYKWYLPVILGYLAAFVMLTYTLKAGLPLGVAYGIWSAGGVAITAVASRLLFQETLNRMAVLGILLITVGVFMVEVSSAH